NVTSQVGQGSCFSLIFDAPRVSAESLPPPRTDPVEPGPADVEPLRGLKILLAEDGPDNQRLITHFLSKAGASVEVAPNGRIAVEMAQRGYNVILMDMQMPELDGYAASSLLRQQGCTIPIIALTAHAMAE